MRGFRTHWKVKSMLTLAWGPVSRPRRLCFPGALLLAAVAGSALPALGQETPVQPPPGPQPQRPEPSPPPPPAGEPQAPAPVGQGPVFDISSFIFRYATNNPDQPPIEQLMPLEVTFGVRDGVLVAQEEGLPTVTMTLGDLTSPQRARRAFSASAINAIAARIVEALNRAGVIGVLVTPDAAQVDPQTLQDLRPPDLRTLTLNIWTRTISGVRTLGAGERWSAPRARQDRPSQETRINHRVHTRIRENSPLQPGSEGVSGDVLQREALDDYLYRLNRHPGRRVDAAISAGETPGDVVLDYIVTENKPWTVYFQLSNTGTEETSEWRERFGFVHYQLTNRDDIFSIDYITASFDDTNAVLASYDAPFGPSERLRYRVYGSWSQFTASDVGFEGENFSGDSWSVGAELTANVWQSGPSFIDLFGGARWENVGIENEAVALEGEADFLVPYIGARFERDRGVSNTLAEARLEFGLGQSDDDEVERLGRVDPDEDWTVFKWRASHSFYVDRFIRGRQSNLLSHELALSVSGQHAFGNRLIPQEQEVIGGLYTVRGYEEALVAGDNVFVASAEYRYHWPRARAPRAPGRLGNRPFRWAPSEAGGRPDWDLILKGFVDAGRAQNNDRLSFEENETLLGAGIGAELQLLRNFNVRVDWGFALKEARDVDTGDNRLHFVLTLLY
jgi:hemolysin activation/secretion protein